jgi:S-adenosylmethionine-dependent methyltransferase
VAHPPATEDARAPAPIAAALLRVLAARRAGDRSSPPSASPGVEVLDVGGGSGSLALALGAQGHRVLVVDPSPDAIPALERRAADAGLSALVTGSVGDVSTAPALVAATGSAAVALVCLHDVLEYLPDPDAALAGLRPVLRPRGLLSLVIPQRTAAVLGRALAGRPEEAAVALHAVDGRWGPGDPAPRRFDRGEIVAMLTRAGLDVELVRGERVVSDLVPGALRDRDAAARRAYRELEAQLATDPGYAALAARLHVVAVAV